MSLDIKNKAWFSKYQPLTIDDLVFESDEHKQLMTKWINNGRIDGNVLFFGKPGLGKTASTEILIRSIIQAQNDLFICKERTVKEIREQVKPFISKRPIKSKQKIVYSEEVDRFHPDAINDLKDGMLEKFQESCSFIFCTNYIGKLKQKDPSGAFLTRFTHKISFNGTNITGIIERLSNILKTENATFDESQLKAFVEKSIGMGIREILNMLQGSYSANNGTIDFTNIQGFAGLEENVFSLIVKIITMVSGLNKRDKQLAIIQPLNSPIAQDYQTLCAILHNNYDINYNNIFDRLYETSKFIPLQLIIARHADENEFKKYPHVNVISCLKEMMECMSNIMG